MRLNNAKEQFRPGAFHSRRQWIFVGLVLGAIGALALNSQTGWIVRKELATALPIACTLDNQVEWMESHRWGAADRNTFNAVVKVTNRAKGDVPLVIAGSLFQELALSIGTSPAGEDAAMSYEQNILRTNSDMDVQMQFVREHVLHDVCMANPDSPAAAAAYIAELLSSIKNTGRPECDWIRAQGMPHGANVNGTKWWALGTVLDTGQGLQVTTNRPSTQVQALEWAAQNGVRCDPQNAFFSMMLTYAHYLGNKDAEALEDIDRAAHAHTFSDYSFELAGGWQRLDKAVYGTPDGAAVNARFGTQIDSRSFWAANSVAQITVWKAIELEHRGLYADGVALRMRIASIGALQYRYRPQAQHVGTMNNLVYISANGPGGIYIPPYTHTVAQSPTPGETQEEEEPYVYAHRCADVYAKYLNRHGFGAEAVWYAPIFKAQYKQASTEYLSLLAAKNNSMLVANLAQRLYPEYIRALGYCILAETVFVVMVGLALGLMGYFRRFAPRRETYWNKSQWGAVLAGCSIAAFCLIGCSILYTNDSAWLLAGVVISAVAIVQTFLRRSAYADTPIALLVHSLCCTLCLFIVAGFSAMGVHNIVIVLGGTWSSSNPFLANTIPFGVSLLVLPALVFFGIIMGHRVRYQGVPSALFYGTRRAILPFISALLILWAVNIVVTAGVERDIRQGICENLGLKSDAPLR